MSTMRDDLNAALDADDGDYEETVQEVLDDVSEDDTTLDATGGVPDSGDTDDTPTAEAAPSEDAAPEAEATSAEPETAEKTLASGDSIKAPIDWGPKEREDWSKIPRHLQEKVMAREKELGTMLQTTAEARQTHKDFSQLTQQYGSALSGVMGNTPMETVSNLFSTVANLRMGSPIQKAQIVADMIETFGVDINTLDSAIVGAAPSQATQQNSEVERMLTERLAPFEQMMGQQNAYQQQQADQRTQMANTEVQQFSTKAEFLGDVRHDMADLIEMAGARGQKMTMEEAYSKACAINPQISSVMAERAKRTALTSGNNSIAAKRAAASSVNGRQIGGGGGGGNLSMHDTIAAAWDSHGSI
jgi:hypothetical protein